MKNFNSYTAKSVVMWRLHMTSFSENFRGKQEPKSCQFKCNYPYLDNQESRFHLDPYEDDNEIYSLCTHRPSSDHTHDC